MNCVGPNAPAQDPTSRSGRDVAVLEDFQGGEEFVAEIVLPPADAGERGGRAQHRPVAGDGAVIGLDAPDRGDDVTVDAIGALDRVEGRAVAASGARGPWRCASVHEDVEIVPDDLVNSGWLSSRSMMRRSGVSDGGVVLEHGARHAAAGGLRPQPREAAAGNWRPPRGSPRRSSTDRRRRRTRRSSRHARPRRPRAARSIRWTEQSARRSCAAAGRRRAAAT